MDNEEIKNRLRKEENAELTRVIEYNGNEYYKTVKFIDDNPKFFYYELKDNSFCEVTDINLLEHFKKFYEITDNVIY